MRTIHDRGRWASIPLLAAATLLTGCAASPADATAEFDEAPIEMPEFVVEQLTRTEVSLAVVTACTMYSDASTLIANADLAGNEQRWTASEVAGSYRLAARMVHRIALDDGSALAAQISFFQDQIDAPVPGAMTTPFDPRDPEFALASADVMLACSDAGFESYLELWQPDAG